MSRLLAATAIAIAAFFLYFYGLSGAGLLGPDEPRYASIGRDMARSGDWITPRLWGEPWFEKPPLLYWMSAAGFLAGLPPEHAVRLPVALLSVLFLALYWRLVREEFDATAASYATLVLSTSAGWLAFSQLGVTDLPLAATFSAAMLLAMRGRPVPAGVALGFAALAKGLVPLALAAPLAWLLWRRWRDLARMAAATMLVASPWYAACTWINGRAFFDEFIVKHHFSRFSSEALQHVQPWWFYAPVLLAAIFPWTPLVALLRPHKFTGDRERLFLLALVLFGFLFFSAATNKLPGYVLPLLPALAVLVGVALAESPQAKWPLAAAALLLAVVPAVADVLPQALASGLSRAARPPVPWALFGAAALLAALVAWLDYARRRAIALVLIAVAIVAAVVHLKRAAYPAMDATVSARQMGLKCAPPALHRSLRYGANFYAGGQLPDCPQ